MKRDSYFKGCISGVEIIQHWVLGRLKTLILLGDLDFFSVCFCAQIKMFGGFLLGFFFFLLVY